MRGKLSLCVVLASFASLSLTAAPSTAGTSFAFVFTRQVLGVSSGYLRVQISGHDSAASGTIIAPLMSYNTTFSVAAASTTYVDLATYLRASWGVESVGLLLTSSQPVSVYVFNSATSSTDASIIYPESQLGTEYIISSYTPYQSLFKFQEVSSTLSVVATVDATSIQLYKYNHTFSGWVLQNPYIANQRGNVVTVNSTSVDYSAYKIISSAPVAVFSGSDCAVVPSTAVIRATSITAGCDTIVDQLMPISQWGTEHVVFADPRALMSHTVRVMSDRDFNITLSSSATNHTVLAGSYHEFDTMSADVITCSNPCQVTQFLHYSHSTVFLNGDPYMVNLVPTNKHGRDFVFSVFDRGSASRWNAEYATIIVPSGQTSGVVVNGVSVGGWSTIGSYAITSITLSTTTATYSITHIDSSVQFGLYISGQSFYESYCYSAGSTFISTISTTIPPAEETLPAWAVGVVSVMSVAALASVAFAVFFWWKKRNGNKAVDPERERRIDEILTKRHLAMVANVQKKQYMDVAQKERLKNPPKDTVFDVDNLNEVIKRPKQPIKPATPSKYAFDLDEDEMIRQVFARTRATTPYQRDPQLRDFVPEPMPDVLVIDHPPSRAGKPPSRGGHPPPSRGRPPPSRGHPPPSRGHPPPSRGAPPSRSGPLGSRPKTKQGKKKPVARAKYMDAAKKVAEASRESKESTPRLKNPKKGEKKDWQD